MSHAIVKLNLWANGNNNGPDQIHYLQSNQGICSPTICPKVSKDSRPWMPWSDKPDGQNILGLCCGMFLNGTSHGQDLMSHNMWNVRPTMSQISLHSLNRALIVCMKKLCILSYPKCTQWRLWSDCKCTGWSKSLLGTHVQRYTFWHWCSDDILYLIIDGSSKTV